MKIKRDNTCKNLVYSWQLISFVFFFPPTSLDYATSQMVVLLTAIQNRKSESQSFKSLGLLDFKKNYYFSVIIHVRRVLYMELFTSVFICLKQAFLSGLNLLSDSQNIPLKLVRKQGHFLHTGWIQVIQ